MTPDCWPVLSQAIAAVDKTFADNPRFTHRTAVIVRTYLWGCAHDRPMSWACQKAHWPFHAPAQRPGQLPHASCLSRRTRSHAFHRFLGCLRAEMSKNPTPQMLDLKCLDGKPLIVAAHSKDPDATWGYGAGKTYKGYKLHCLWGSSLLPERSAVTPLDRDERAVARRLLRDLLGGGYVLADGNYDANALHALCTANGYQLISPRDTPGKGLGHRKQRPGRLRSMALLEARAFGLGRFGPSLFALRRRIEQRYGNLTAFGGGLAMSLPAWVRRIWRVRNWTTAKLLIYAAHTIQKTKQIPCAA